MAQWYKRRLGFFASEFIKASGTFLETWDIDDGGTPYDVDSIMHYFSIQGANRKCYFDKIVDECPLVKYKEPRNPGAGVEMIERHRRLSEGDVRMIRSCIPGRSRRRRLKV
jgi:hypothetical protein